MSNKVKERDIKNRSYYVDNDIMDIITFDPSNTKIAEKSHKNILIYYIGYVAIKDSKHSNNVKVNNLNSLLILFGKVNGYFEEINGNKILTLVLTGESKKEKKM